MAPFDGLPRERDMRKRHRSWFAVLAAVILAVTMAAGPAWAQSLNELRARGVVGERFDGFAQVRDAGASQSARSVVNAVNQKRRQIYAKDAAQQGVPAGQVGRVYAKQIMQKAPKGTWFLGESERWTRK